MPAPRPGARPGGGRPDGSRAAARAAVRRTAGRAATPPPSSRSAVTTRAAVLGLVLCFLVLSAAVPLREYLAQRSEISQAEQAQAQAKRRIAALEARQAQLQDPVQVREMARERFGFVLPGETLYTVLRPSAAPSPSPTGGQVRSTDPEQPWYQQVWGSLATADATG